MAMLPPAAKFAATNLARFRLLLVLLTPLATTG